MMSIFWLLINATIQSSIGISQGYLGGKVIAKAP